MRFIFEGDFFMYHRSYDTLAEVGAAIHRSRKAYSTKAHPEDKVENTWISRRIRRVFDETGTCIFPPKRAHPRQINKGV